MWGSAAADRDAARSRRDPDTPRAPGDGPVRAESRPRAARALIGSARARWTPSCLRGEVTSALIRPGHVPVDGGSVPAQDAAQAGGRGRREEAANVRCGIGLLGRPASESGSLCHWDGATHGAIVAGGCSCCLRSSAADAGVAQRAAAWRGLAEASPVPPRRRSQRRRTETTGAAAAMVGTPTLVTTSRPASEPTKTDEAERHHARRAARHPLVPEHRRAAGQ